MKKNIEEMEVGDVLVINGKNADVLGVFSSFCVIASQETKCTLLFGFEELKNLEAVFLSSEAETTFPKYGDVFFRLNTKGEIIEAPWTGSQKQIACLGWGNCFRTRDDAKLARERFSDICTTIGK